MEEAIAMKLQYTTTAGATETYTKRDIMYDINHGYLKLADSSDDTAALLICDQYRASEPIEVTVEDCHGSWENVQATEHVLLAKTGDEPTAQLPEYTRNSKEPRAVEEEPALHNRLVFPQRRRGGLLESAATDDDRHIDG